MPKPEQIRALDLSSLTGLSREFATKLFERFPEMSSVAKMYRINPQLDFELFIEYPSPTGDMSRNLIVWVEDDEYGEPSIRFGPWDTHASVWKLEVSAKDEISALLDLIQAIVADKFVLIKDIGTEYDANEIVLDLRDPDALVEELTGKWSSGKIRIRSFSGTRDGEFRLEDQNFS